MNSNINELLFTSEHSCHIIRLQGDLSARLALEGNPDIKLMDDSWQKMRAMRELGFKFYNDTLNGVPVPAIEELDKQTGLLKYAKYAKSDVTMKMDTQMMRNWSIVSGGLLSEQVLDMKPLTEAKNDAEEIFALPSMRHAIS